MFSPAESDVASLARQTGLQATCKHGMGGRHGRGALGHHAL